MASRPKRTAGGVKADAASAEIAALTTATLDELKARYPEQWQRTGEALVAAVQKRRASGAAEFLARAHAEAAPWHARLASSGGNPRVARGGLPVLVRERMSQLAVKQVVDGAVAATGGDQAGAQPQVLRFGRWSGSLVQALFFRGGLERKAVGPLAFRLLWPLVTQKQRLMPLVRGKGIYCFHGRPLIAGLRALIGGQPALEIAAGDGTLTRLLNEAGAAVRATDDQSWSHVIGFPEVPAELVEKLSASEALARYQPRVVLCSWPPPDNTFEREVFRAPSVDRYIVITSRHRLAASAWADYETQTRFDQRADPALSRWVLPPEIDPLVLVFDRREPAAAPAPTRQA